MVAMKPFISNTCVLALLIAGASIAGASSILANPPEEPNTAEPQPTSTDEPKLPGWKEVPHQLVDSKFGENEDKSLTVDVGGKVVSSFPDQGDDSLRGSVYLTVGLDLDFVAFELGISTEQLITEAIESDYDEESGFLEGPLKGRRAEDLLHTLKAVVTPFKIGEDEWMQISLVAGRDNATPVGSYIAEWVPAINVMESRSLAEQDLIAVQATLFKYITVQVVSFGHDVLPRIGKATEDINQDGNGSFAINATADLAKVINPDSELGVEIYLSYAQIDDGLTYVSAADSDQPGEGNQTSVGARISAGQLVLAGEYTNIDSDSMGKEDRFSIYGFYSIDRVTPFAGYEKVDSDSGMDEDSFSVGIGYKLARGLMLAFQAVIKDNDETDFLVGLTYGAKALTRSDMRTE